MLANEQIDKVTSQTNWPSLTFADGTQGIALDSVTARDFARAIEAEVRAEAQEPLNCPHCDGTGDVHSPDGEWRGECNCGAPQESAKSKFDRLIGDEKETPVERLRFFCSLAMSGQDWIDVEPFFDALTAPQPPTPCPKCAEFALFPNVDALRQCMLDTADENDALRSKFDLLVIERDAQSALISDQQADVEKQTEISNNFAAQVRQQNATIAQQAERIAEFEKVAKAYEDQVAAHNKTLDEVARLSALIEKCEEALRDYSDQEKRDQWCGPATELLAFIAAMKGGAK